MAPSPAIGLVGRNKNILVQIEVDTVGTSTFGNGAAVFVIIYILSTSPR